MADLSGVDWTNADAIREWHVEFRGELAAETPRFNISEQWFGPFVLVIPGAPKTIKMPFTTITPRAQRYNGRPTPQQPTTHVAEFVRGDAQFIGVTQHEGKLISGTDFGALAQSPREIGQAVNNVMAIGIADVINNAFTLTSGYHGKTLAVLSTAATADQIPVNLGNPNLGRYFNARENLAFTADNISTLFSDLRTRRGYDGRYLGGPAREAFVFGGPAHGTKADEILDKIEWSQVGGTGGTSTAYKRAPFMEITDLRDDLWGVGYKPMTRHELPVVSMLGQSPNSDVMFDNLPMWQIQTPEQLPQTQRDKTPHRRTEIIDQSHPIYVMSRHLGMQVVIVETHLPMSASTLAFAYTGAAS